MLRLETETAAVISASLLGKTRKRSSLIKLSFLLGATSNIHYSPIRCEVFRAMFAEQKQQTKSVKAKDTAKPAGKGATPAPPHDVEGNVPLVLPDVRPTGNGNCVLFFLFLVFLALLEFIYTNSCKLSQTTVRTSEISSFFLRSLMFLHLPLNTIWRALQSAVSSLSSMD